MRVHALRKEKVEKIIVTAQNSNKKNPAGYCWAAAVKQFVQIKQVVRRLPDAWI